MGQTHVQRWTDDSSAGSRRGRSIPPSSSPTPSRSSEGPEMYQVFRDKQDSCIKVVLKP